MAAWHCAAVSAAAGEATASVPSRAEVATTTRMSWRRVIAPGRLLSLAVSAGTGDRARAGVKETGEAVEPTCMRIDDQADGGAAGTAGIEGAAGASRWGWGRVRLPRPTGIRNGALLLVLVALAAVIALVEE